MNESSHPKHENHYNIYHNILRANPHPSGVARPPRRASWFKGKGTKPPRGRPAGGGDVYRIRGYGGLNPHH